MDTLGTIALIWLTGFLALAAIEIALHRSRADIAWAATWPLWVVVAVVFVVSLAIAVVKERLPR